MPTPNEAEGVFTPTNIHTGQHSYPLVEADIECRIGSLRGYRWAVSVCCPHYIVVLTHMQYTAFFSRYGEQVLADRWPRWRRIERGGEHARVYVTWLQ